MALDDVLNAVIIGCQLNAVKSLQLVTHVMVQYD